jgi:simple sugar transport system permease protein/ribose transport system permease protein
VKSKVENNQDKSGTAVAETTISRRIVPAIGNNFVWVLVVIMVIVAGVLNPAFWSLRNLLNILNANAYLSAMVLGMSLVLITKNIDISFESNMIFTAMVGGILVTNPALGGMGLPWPLVLIAMLVLSTLIGLFISILVVKFHMNSLMVTIAMLIGLLGGALVLAKDRTIRNLPDGFRFIGAADIGPVSVAVLLMLFIFIIAAVVLKKTTFGAHIYAVGGNRPAARAAGIDDDRVVTSAYVFCGFFAGLAAVILMGRLGTASAGMSQGVLFLVVAAAVIGGVSLEGGRGGAGGMVGGLLLMGMISNVLTLAGVSANYTNAVTGLIIVLALGIDSFRRRRQLRE